MLLINTLTLTLILSGMDTYSASMAGFKYEYFVALATYTAVMIKQFLFMFGSHCGII